MSNILYSIIVPHHNNPTLLYRLIDSIPVRDDVEIIIVDDNSASDLKPSALRKDTNVIFLDKENSKWAGHARNVGLDNAKGKFLIFADCDDYFTDNFLPTLDKYKEDDFQILYFGCSSVDSETLQPSDRTELREKLLAEFIKGNVDELKYKIRFPWGKIFLKDWVITNHFRFEEICKGNDIQFSYMTNYLAKKIKAIDDILYVCTFRPNSMTYQKRSVLSHLTSISNFYKIKGFYEFVEHPEWRTSIFRVYARIFRNTGIVDFFNIMFQYLVNLNKYKQQKYLYKNKILNHLNCMSQ